MPYVLPDSFLVKLATLRKDYKTRSKTELDKSSQPNTISIFFGAKNINARDQQIHFIENWILSLAADLKPQLDFSNENEIHHHLKALRILIAVCVYIMSLIGSSYTIRKATNAILDQLLCEALHIQNDNVIDDVTRDCCLLEARAYIKPYLNAASINRALHTKFTEDKWYEFQEFLNVKCKKSSTVSTSNYPMTSIMMPFFATPFQLAGYSAGYVLGDMLRKSTTFLHTRYVISATVSSSVVFLMRSSPGMFALLLIPTYAGKFLDAYCGVSMAWLMGKVMNILGNGVGFGVGMTLDVGGKFLFKVCSLFSNLFQSESQLPNITGFTMVDSRRIAGGMELQLVELESSPVYDLIDTPNNKQIVFDVKKDGIYLQIGDETAMLPWSTSIPNIQEFLLELEKDLEEENVLIENKQEDRNACMSLF